MPPDESRKAASRQSLVLPFGIIDEGSDWIAVNKPPMLQVHPKKPGGPVTLLERLQEFLAYELANGATLSIINRLDRETSGVVLIAKGREAGRRYHIAMQQRAFEKEYLALVWGWPEWEEVRLSAPILRQGEKMASPIYLKRCVHPEGAEAATRFRVLHRWERAATAGGRFALVHAFPETGRTHQIRVHLAHLGHPVVGDKIYGPDPGAYLEFIETGWTEALASRLLLSHHALHSVRLRVAAAAVGGDGHDWRAPLPEDVAAWLAEAGVDPGEAFGGGDSIGGDLLRPFGQTWLAAPR